jgi:hypothetical protein
MLVCLKSLPIAFTTIGIIHNKQINRNRKEPSRCYKFIKPSNLNWFTIFESKRAITREVPRILGHICLRTSSGVETVLLNYNRDRKQKRSANLFYSVRRTNWWALPGHGWCLRIYSWHLKESGRRIGCWREIKTFYWVWVTKLGREYVQFINADYYSFNQVGIEV